jgi:hypothetical protein
MAGPNGRRERNGRRLNRSRAGIRRERSAKTDRELEGDSGDVVGNQAIVGYNVSGRADRHRAGKDRRDRTRRLEWPMGGHPARRSTHSRYFWILRKQRSTSTMVALLLLVRTGNDNVARLCSCKAMAERQSSTSGPPATRPYEGPTP